MKNPFQGMTKREIMIEIGQISEDETWENDIFFNISLELVGKQSSRLVDTILLDFKDKINSKYLKLYNKQLRVILANLFTSSSINEDLFVVYSRDREHYKKLNRYNPNRISYRPLIFLVDSLKEHEWIKNILGSQKKAIDQRCLPLTNSNKLSRIIK